MTDTEIVQYVQAHIGGERRTRIVKPMILAMANLAYKDLAEWLIDNDLEQAKKLRTSALNQTWASSQFTAPSNMLFKKQKDHTIIDFAGTVAYQLEDRQKLDLASSSIFSNIYYALEGKTFYFKNPNGSGGSNLNIFYYKIPSNSDIDGELRNKFLELLIDRLMVKNANSTERDNS